MAKLAFVLLLTVTMTLAKPAKKEALDKATEIDVVVNSISPEQKPQANPTNSNVGEIKPGVDNAGSNIEVVYHTPDTFAIPTRDVAKPGTGLARIIDDIFQIPIGVLQSVSRLLTNPFIQQKKTPETVTSY